MLSKKFGANQSVHGTIWPFVLMAGYYYFKVALFFSDISIVSTPAALPTVCGNHSTSKNQESKKNNCEMWWSYSTKSITIIMYHNVIKVNTLLVYHVTNVSVSSIGVFGITRHYSRLTILEFGGMCTQTLLFRFFRQQRS